MEYDLSKPSGKKRISKTRICIFVAFFSIILFGSGFLIGYFSSKTTSSENGKERKARHDFQDFHDMFQDGVSVELLRENLRLFSSRVHVAGTDRQTVLANYLAEKWREFGFDEVEMPKYKVLLSHPQQAKPNTISLIRDGNVEYMIEGKIKLYPDPRINSTQEFFPFVGYAPNGTVEGELVYVNYGTESDYQQLESLNISVKGKIVLSRNMYTAIKTASKLGAIGFISFPNPEFLMEEGTGDNETYPNTPWLSKDAIVQWSMLTTSYQGDPLTPGIPATDGMYRIPHNNSYLPDIPAQPISYRQAMELLKRLKGPQAPPSWRTGLNFNARTGPGFQTERLKLRLEVNTQRNLTIIYNVIGTITGSEEPDRYVMVGNHRDSWVFGAVDALSGTTTIHEIARLLGTLRKSGWRPRRSIKICSWGAEEWKLFGSSEWVEQKSKLLLERAVAYINLDIAVSGNFVLRARASPLFKNITYKWALKVKHSLGDQGKTVYDTWLARDPSLLDVGKPMIYNLFHSSDYVMFYDYLGIPASDYGYWYGYKNKSIMYPVYHTTEDTFYWMEKFGDPNFQAHRAITQLSGGIILDVADSVLLPFRLLDYAKQLNYSYSELVRSNLFFNTDIPEKHLRFLKEAVFSFVDAANAFDARKEQMTRNHKHNPVELRVVNDQMVEVEKAFIAPNGLAGKPYDRHVAFNFGFRNIEHGMYATFPGVTTAAYKALETNNWGEVKRQLSVVINAVRMATDIIKPVKFPNNN